MCDFTCIRHINQCGDISWNVAIPGKAVLTEKGHKQVFRGTGFVLDLDVGTGYMGELKRKNLICTFKVFTFYCICYTLT